MHIIIWLIAIIVMIYGTYSLLKSASDADDQAEEMQYRNNIKNKE